MDVTKTIPSDELEQFALEVGLPSGSSFTLRLFPTETVMRVMVQQGDTGSCDTLLQSAGLKKAQAPKSKSNRKH